MNELLKRIKNHISDHYARDRYEHQEAQLKYDKVRARQKMLNMQLREYEHQLKILGKVQGISHTGEEVKLLNKIYDAKTELRGLRLKRHLNSESNEKSDFNHYYRHIRIIRPFALVFNLTLWFLLFWFGGVGTGLKIVILLFALMTTAGSIFELIFLVNIKDRILKPIENLKKGVSEVAQGNYDVTISEEKTYEVNSLIKAFNEMSKKLRESEKLKIEYEENRKALIINISHDLKTPITSIQGYVEAITDNDEILQDKLEQYLKVIHNNTVYMNRLIDDLFLFSKLDMQKLEFNFTEINICPFIEDMMEEFKLEVEEKNIGFEYNNILTMDHIVKMDAKRFYRIIRNIIDNAVKYGLKSKLKIVTELYEEGGYVNLDISDNGPGIPEESLPHILERFYRADNERTKDMKSTGLGLAIAKELIEAHGGKIAVSSKENQGSTFTVSLPYIKKDVSSTSEGDKYHGK